MTDDPRNTLARAWLRDVLLWARWAESHHPDPVGRYHDAAIDALLIVVDWSLETGEAITRGRLMRTLLYQGRKHTATTRRRRARLQQWPIEGREANLIDWRTSFPDWQAQANEEASEWRP